VRFGCDVRFELSFSSGNGPADTADGLGNEDRRSVSPAAGRRRITGRGQAEHIEEPDSGRDHEGEEATAAPVEAASLAQLFRGDVEGREFVAFWLGDPDRAASGG
jgi:hypothetical protein